jgi:hypothetical protein
LIDDDGVLERITPQPQVPNWDAALGLVAEMHRCNKMGAVMPAVAMAFICIDTMAFLSLPANRETQGRPDFIAWVDKYLKAHERQPYQYRGIDVYGARCAVLHAFGSQSDYHERYPDAKQFGYNNGGQHLYDAQSNPSVVVIGTKSFTNDVAHAVSDFFRDCQDDVDLRERVSARLARVLYTFPVRVVDAPG